MALPDVEAYCAEAFGPAWLRAEESFQQRVSEPVADAHLLGLAARRRWAEGS